MGTTFFLLLAAAATAQPAARLEAVATASIVSGARISLAAEPRLAEGNSKLAIQQSRFRRDRQGVPTEYRLVEFQ